MDALTQRQRRAKYGANVGMSVVLALAILVAVNFVANRHSKKFDLTKGGMNTLADQTVKVLGNLKEDVQITAFFSKEAVSSQESDEKDKFEKLVTMYKYASDKLKVDYVDP